MRLVDLVALDAPVVVSDAYGGTGPDWQESFRCRAAIRYLRGGEAVQAARMEGRQPAVVTVRRAPESEAVDASWRLRDLRREVTYAVRSVVWTDDRRYVEITAESGVEP